MNYENTEVLSHIYLINLTISCCIVILTSFLSIPLYLRVISSKRHFENYVFRLIVVNGIVSIFEFISFVFALSIGRIPNLDRLIDFLNDSHLNVVLAFLFLYTTCAQFLSSLFISLNRLLFITQALLLKRNDRRFFLISVGASLSLPLVGSFPIFFGNVYYAPVITPSGKALYTTTLPEMILLAPFAIFLLITALLSNFFNLLIALQLMKIRTTNVLINRTSLVLSKAEQGLIVSVVVSSFLQLSSLIVGILAGVFLFDLLASFLILFVALFNVLPFWLLVIFVPSLRKIAVPAKLMGMCRDRVLRIKNRPVNFKYNMKYLIIIFSLMEIVSSLTCYIGETSDKAYPVIQSSIVESRRGCEVLCDANAQCTAFAFKDLGFKSQCALLGTQKSSKCAEAMDIFVKKSDGCPSRNIWDDMGADPCFSDFSSSDIQVDTDRLVPICKKSTQILRAITENGRRITLDNDNFGQKMITTNGKWIYSYEWMGQKLEIPPSLQHASPQTSDSVKCGCDPLPTVSVGMSVATETRAVCATPTHKLRVTYFKCTKSSCNTEIAWSNSGYTATTIKCQAGAWFVYTNSPIPDVSYQITAAECAP